MLKGRGSGPVLDVGAGTSRGGAAEWVGARKTREVAEGSGVRDSGPGGPLAEARALGLVTPAAEKAGSPQSDPVCDGRRDDGCRDPAGNIQPEGLRAIGNGYCGDTDQEPSAAGFLRCGGEATAGRHRGAGTSRGGRLGAARVGDGIANAANARPRAAPFLGRLVGRLESAPLTDGQRICWSQRRCGISAARDEGLPFEAEGGHAWESEAVEMFHVKQLSSLDLMEH